MRYLASARSAGSTLPVGRRRRRRRGRRDGRPLRHRPRPVLRSGLRVAGAGAAARRRRRHRDRQLLGLAHGPRRAARRARGQRRPSCAPSPRASWPIPTAPPWSPSRSSSPSTTRPVSAGSWSPRTRRCRAAASTPCASWPSSCPRRSTGRGPHLRRLVRRLPASQRVPGPDRPQRDPAAVQDRRRRLARDRRGAEVLQRGPQDPRAARPRRDHHLRARARLHRALGRHRVRVRATHHPRARHRGAADRARESSWPRSRRR